MMGLVVAMASGAWETGAAVAIGAEVAIIGRGVVETSGGMAMDPRVGAGVDVVLG